jgi:hypothetical protein
MAWLPALIVGTLLSALGLRLIHSGRAAGGPEVWLGGFFAAAGIAMPLQVSAAGGVDLGVDPGWIGMVAQAASLSGLAMLLQFVQRVFRPGSAWARRAGTALCVLLVFEGVLLLATGAYRVQSSPVHSLVTLTLTSVFGWAFVESLVYWNMMRRRCAIGAGDPVVANRFGLWCLWTGILTLFSGVVSSARIYALTTSVPQAEGLAVRAEFLWVLDLIRVMLIVTGPVMISSLWLSFFPPPRYLNWLRSRAQA